MKKLFILPILFIFIFIYPALSQEIIVGVYDNPPMIFYKDGTADGFFIELLEYIAEREGWELRYVYGTFPELIEKLKKGEIDILPDVAYTPERERIFSFNRESVFNNWGVIITADRIETITDLDGKRVAGVRQDIYFKNLRKLASSFGVKCTFVEVEGDYRDVFGTIKNGAADAGVVSRIYGNLYSREYGLKITPVIFSPVELRFAGARGREVYLEKIDHHLEILKEDGDSIYYQLLGKWTETPRTETPYWAKYLIAASVFLGFLFTYRELYLKRELSRRKSEIVKVNRLLEKIIRINEAIIVERNPEKLGLRTSSMLSEYRSNAVLLFLSSETIAFMDGKRVPTDEVLRYECMKSVISKKTTLEIPPGFHPETCIHGEKAGNCFGYSFPMLYGSEFKGLIFIMSEEKLSGQEKRILETLAGDMAYALHDFELERERNAVLKQLEENINNMMVLVDRIKNPLTVILGVTELRCQEVRDEIEREIANILRIVKEIERGWLESEDLEKKLEKY